MDWHVRMVGVLNILFGAISAVAGVVIALTVGSPFQIYRSENLLGVLIGLSAIFHLALAIPCLVGGIYILTFAPWSRGLLICASSLNLLNLPVGAAIGSYSLWVLMTEETDPLFAVRPPIRSFRS